MGERGIGQTIKPARSRLYFLAVGAARTTGAARTSFDGAPFAGAGSALAGAPMRIRVLIAAAAALVATSGLARADFRVCNNTASRTSLALAYTDGAAG